MRLVFLSRAAAHIHTRIRLGCLRFFTAAQWILSCFIFSYITLYGTHLMTELSVSAALLSQPAALHCTDSDGETYRYQLRFAYLAGLILAVVMFCPARAGSRRELTQKKHPPLPPRTIQSVLHTKRRRWDGPCGCIETRIGWVSNHRLTVNLHHIL